MTDGEGASRMILPSGFTLGFVLSSRADSVFLILPKQLKILLWRPC